jgi:hypothetical protein
MKSPSTIDVVHQTELTYCQERPQAFSRITGWKRKLLLAVLLGSSFSGCTHLNRNPQRESLVDLLVALFSEEPETPPAEDQPDIGIAAPDSSSHIASSEETFQESRKHH